MCGHIIIAVSGILASMVHISSGLPCCQDNNTLSQHNHNLCSDNTPLWLYNRCHAFYMVDPKIPPLYETYHEDETKEQLTFHNNQWKTKDYCTVIIADVNKTGSEYEVAMVCFEEKQNSVQFSIYGICLIVSSVFLIATFVVYLMLPELRDLQGKCMMCFIFSLTLGYLSLAFIQLPYTSALLTFTFCVLIAFNTYFWLLSAFCWLNIISFNVWRSTVLSHREFSEGKLLVSYLCAGWGIPIAFLLFALITHIIPKDVGIIRPNFGVEKCWFQGNPELWSFFYGPVAVLIGLNIVYFISTAWYLWSDYSNPAPIPRIRSLRFKFTMYLKIFLTMGVTWIFEIISFIDAGETIIWYITDAVNCLQGVIIFLVMVVTRKRVLRALARRKLCGLKRTTAWETIDDEETEQQFIPEEIQLSNDKI